MTLKDIVISVIMPVYNPEISLLKKALDSVLCQTIENVEIIIVDDGSSYDYSNLINEYLENSKIKFIKLQENNGSGFARNIGIKRAKGDFIAFLDADDYYISNDVLEKLYVSAKAHRVKVSGGKAMAEYNGDICQIIWSFKNYSELFTNIVADIKDFQNCYGFWCFLYERNFIIKNNFYFNDLISYQDPIWFYEILCKCKKFYCSDFPFYYHRTKNMVKFNWNKKALTDYFKGITLLSQMSLKNKHYDLHTFLYRKALFWEYQMFLRAKEELNIDIANEFTNFLKSFNFNIIKQCEPDIPILKTIDEFRTIDISKYKEFDY